MTQKRQLNFFLSCMGKMDTLPEGTLNLLHRISFRLKSDLSTPFYEALKNARTKRVDKDFSTFRGIPYRTIFDTSGTTSGEACLSDWRRTEGSYTAKGLS